MNEIYTADCMEKLDDLEANSVHAVVTDPPYGLAFMGRSWDDFEPKEYQKFCEKWAKRCKRVLKPGGHLLAFSGNRTHHRLFTGVEDAGFEIRDTLTWHYGSGFPKASDIGKTIDKRADAEREVIGEKETNTGITGDNYGQESESGTVDITEPATDAAKKWDGWKTGLKPATEYVVMARKPFDGATVDCVQEHGTGALNIDECRIESGDVEIQTATRDESRAGEMYVGGDDGSEHGDEVVTSASPEGRYPSNVIFDETQAHALDEAVGDLDGTWGEESRGKDNGMFGVAEGGESADFYDNNGGGPSRYFYTSKATKAERTLDGKIANAHPTVKPTDLMEWLVKLVTREEQTVLDPFTGSGTTLKACKNLNREFIGIEKQAKWADIARVRVGLTPNDPSVVREDDQQQGLESYE